MIHHERDKIRRPSVTLLRTLTLHKQLKRYPFFYWTCPPDVGKQSQATMARMKKDGYEKGVYDMTIIAGNAHEMFVWLIEFKYGANPLTDEQKQTWTKAQNIRNVNTLIIKSYQQFEEFVTLNFK